MEESLVNTIVAGAASGSVIAAILALMFHRRKAAIENEVKHQFAEALEAYKSRREWKEQSLSELLGPVVMYIARTEPVAERYRFKTHGVAVKSYSDAMLLRESNEAVRTVLLSKGHLLPENLRSHAHELVEHYDEWISRFDAILEIEKPTANSVFDVGLPNVPFPEKAGAAFTDAYETLRGDLYDIAAIKSETGTDKKD